MTAVRPLDVAALPLEGTALLEASAGTGKTWTLAALFLRLVLERGLAVHEVLVVTFTDASTQELRRRLRERLREALTDFRADKSLSDDPVTAGLLPVLDRDLALSRLESAIRDFDQAAVHTIHGFCRRVLGEMAFETRQAFQSDMTGSDEAHLRQAALDFWRCRVSVLHPLLQSLLIDGGLSPDALAGLGGLFMNHPEARLAPTPTPSCLADVEAMIQPFLAAFARAASLWEREHDAAADALRRGAGELKQNSHKTENLQKYHDELDLFLRGAPFPKMPAGALKLTASQLATGTKKGCATPRHAVFDALDELAAAGGALADTGNRLSLELRLGFLAGLRDSLEARKRSRNVMTFHDLILRVGRAVLSPGAAPVIRTLRSRFRAALIDEFQDTDPGQYAVFHALFHHPGCFLCMVGDPKQAIYSFRGADLHAYIRARKDVAGLYGLDTNHRSDHGMVQAVNALFSGHPAPFQLADLEFRRVAPTHPDRLFLDGQPASGLHIWRMDRLAGDALAKNGLHKADPARNMAVSAVAAEISRLLSRAGSGGAHIQEKGATRPLAPGDMAVLVYSRAQAQMIYDALSVLNIPCVLQRIENIFDSREAREVLRILEAARNPADERLLRAALATDIMGWDAARIHALDADEDARVERLDRCALWREAWTLQGFMGMFRTLVREEGVQERLLRLPRGERRMTNLLHLVELLHEEEHARGLAPEDLAAWLAQRVNAESERLEEYNQRLESDEQAVKILTMHKSKGLEFNVVFCPFLFKQGGMPSPADIYHAPEDSSLRFDLGDSGEASALARAERHAETLRLFYVALTRARHRCYLAWGAVNEGDTSAPAWLLHTGSAVEGPAALAGLGGLLARTSDQDIRDRLDALHSRCPSLTHGPIPREPGTPRAAANGPEAACELLPYYRRLDRSWRITSYTALAGTRGGRRRLGDEMDAPCASAEGVRPAADGPAPGLPGGPVNPDAPALTTHPPLPGEPQAQSPLPASDPGRGAPPASLPAGPAMGILLHGIMERADLSRITREEAEAMAARVLARQGLPGSLADSVADLVILAAETELLPGLRLRDVPWTDRAAEFEFHLPLDRLTRGALATAYARHESALPPGFAQAAAELDFAPCTGFLTGSMDLVFRKDGRHYLIDWKSNRLGAEDAYSPEGLTRTMAGARYFLQYHLYCLALDRHLARCLPGYRRKDHFGGVFYVFLRGLRPGQPGCGVFHDLPPDAFLDDLAAAILAPGGA